MSQNKSVIITPAFVTPAGIIATTLLAIMMVGGLYLLFTHSFRFGYSTPPLAGWVWALPLLIACFFYRIRFEREGDSILDISSSFAGITLSTLKCRVNDLKWVPYHGKNKFFTLFVHNQVIVVIDRKTALKIAIAVLDS